MRKTALTTIAISLLLGEAALAADFHTRVYKTSSTFTIPSSTGTSTDFEFTTVGAGGGAGGSCTPGVASGGGAGAVGIASFSGFNPNDTVTITVGAGGAAGVGNAAGGTGGTTKVTYAGVDIITATGGTGSTAVNPSSSPGIAGSYSDTVGTTSLNRHSTLSLGAQNGEPALGSPFNGNGGTNSVGVGGVLYGPSAPAGGGGGAGCNADSPSGAGGDGYVIIHWVS
jgi:hypothetical protein